LADIALGIVGGVVGSFYGNWQGGFSIGMTLGGLLFPPDAGEVENGKTDVSIQNSSYGTPIPIIYKEQRKAGTIVWGTEAREVVDVSGGGKGQPTVKNYRYYISLAILVCGVREIHKIKKIYANSKVIYENTTGTGYVAASPVTSHGTGAKWEKYLNPDNVRIYLGSSTQPRDPVIEAAMGIASTPAYRGRALVVFEDLPLEPFNRSIPNFEFEIEADDGDVTLEYFLDDLCERCDIGSGDRDFSDLSSILLKGCSVDSRTETNNIVRSAEKAYLFDFVEYDAKVRGLRSAAIPDTSFDASMLGAGVKTPREEQYELTRTQETEIARQLNVTYPTKAMDFQTFTQTAGKVGGSVDDPESLVLPFVMDEIEAKKVGLVHVHLKDMRRNLFTIEYPLRGLKYSPGDVLPTTLQDIGDVKLKILENYMDFFGTMKSIAVLEDQRVYTQSASGTTVDYPNSTLDEGDVARFRLIDTGAVLDAYSDHPTILYAGSGSGSPWQGASVKVTGNIRAASGSWVDKTADLNVYSTIGRVLSPVPTWDPANVIQDIDVFVELFTGSLSSATESELWAGKNLAAWGEELIQFKTAVNTSGSLWTLTGILRSRRGTDWASSHVANEPFVLINDATTRVFMANQTEYGTVRTHVMYESAVDYSSSSPESIAHSMECNSAKALSPVHFAIARDGSQNATLTWIRRDRKGYDWTDGSDVPMSEASLGFKVEVYDASYSTLKRTIDVSAETASYTAAEQVTDFGSTQSTIYVKICQTQSDKPWGKGHPGVFQG
jgi:hypothetical protein